MSREAKLVSGEMAGVDRNVRQAARGVVAGSGAFRGFGRAIAFASSTFLGAAGLTAVLRAGYDELGQAARASAQTAAALKSTGGAANVTAREIDALANSLLRKTGIDDEQIKSSENLLLTFTNVRNEAGKGNDVFRQAEKAIVDLSVAMDQDLKTSTVQVGKALNDPVKGMTALRRIGVSFTDDQQKLVKQLVGTGRAMDAQKLILAELRKEFGGSAEAVGKTLPGQFNILRETLRNTEADLLRGTLPALTSVLQAVQAYTNRLGEWASKAENQRKIQRAVTGAVDAFTKVAQDAWPVVRKIATAAGDAADAVGGWKNAIKLLIALKLASVLGGWRTSIAKLIGTEAAAGAAGSGLAGAAGSAGLLRGRLAALAKIGSLAIGIDLIYRSSGDKGAIAIIERAAGLGLLGRVLLGAKGGAIGIAIGLAPAAAKLGAAAGQAVFGPPADTSRPQLPPVPLDPFGTSQTIPIPTTDTHGARLKSAFGSERGPNLDFMQKPGTVVGSPDSGVIVNVHSFGEDIARGVYGWGMYLYADDGSEYFMTHFAVVFVKNGQRVFRGTPLGTVHAFYDASHIHIEKRAVKVAQPQATSTSTATSAGGGSSPYPDTTTRDPSRTVAHPPKKGRKTAAPSIQDQIDALFGIKETKAERTTKLSDDANVIAAEIRWVKEQLAGNPTPEDALDLNRLLTELLGKAKDITAQEHEKQKALAAEFARQQQAPGPSQPELEDAATRPGRASELGAVGVAASRRVINQRIAADAAAARAAHAKELAEEDARWKRLQEAGRRGVKRYNDAIRAAAAAGVEMLKGVDLSKRLLAGLKELPRTAMVTIGSDLFGRPIEVSVSKARTRIAELVNIIQTGSKQAREKAIEELGQLAGAIGQAMDAANEAAKQHVQELEGTFETAFGRVGDRILTGFDRVTQATVNGMQADISAQIDAINRQTQQKIDQLNEQVSEKIDQLQRETQEKVKQLQEAGQALTPAEAQLAGLQAQHDAQQTAQALADAQRQLAEAKTPEERLAAQRQIDDILYQQRIAALQKTAQAERAARDKQTQDQVDALQEQEQKQEKALQKELSNRVQKLQDESAAQASALQTQLAAQVQNYEDQRAAQRQWLADQLVAWQTNIENGSATMQDFITWLQGQGANGVLQGVDIGDPVAAMSDAGQAQGSAFADAFIDELHRAYQAYLNFLAAVASPPPVTGPQNAGVAPIGQPPGFQAGGRVPGVYIGRKDTILVRTTPGETVISRRDTERLSNMLDAFEGGGLGGPAINIERMVRIDRPNFLGSTPRQVNQAVARRVEPHLGRLASYRSPI